jgi:hypothetical protein
MSKAKLTAKRLAGADHAVLTIEDAANRYRRKPCSDCPWRIDATGEFPAEAFILSANTATDGASLAAAIVKGAAISNPLATFACHQSGAERPAVCAGYILRGESAIGWRIALAKGRFDPVLVSDDDIELHESYFEMAIANGVDPDDPALDHCRPWRR